MSYGVGRRCSWDLVLLWLWCRLAAVARIPPLAWEPPCAALTLTPYPNPEKQKKKKKKKKNNNKVHTLVAPEKKYCDLHRHQFILMLPALFGLGGGCVFLFSYVFLS